MRSEWLLRAILVEGTRRVVAVHASRSERGANESWPILVISLDDATERRQRIEKTLGELGLEFEFVSAVDGRTGIPPHLQHRVDPVSARIALGRPMIDTEFACALSHILCYERIIDSGLPGAIILEDDAEIDTAFLQFLKLRGYARFAFVQFDYNAPVVWSRWLGLNWRVGEIRLLRLVFNAPLATGYSLSSRAAQYLLENVKPVRLPADWPCDMTRLSAMVTVPRLVRSWAQGSSQSYIATDRGRVRKGSGALSQREAETTGGVDRHIGKGVVKDRRNPIPSGFRFWRRGLTKRLRRPEERS